MSEKLRLRYSGLIVFASRIVSIFTGLAFSIIVIRNLSQTDFGAWTNIGNVVRTLGVAAGLFPFWAGRFTARRFPGAMKVGLIGNLCIAALAALVTIILGPIFASAADTSSRLYVYSAVLVIQGYVIGSLEPIVLIRRPQMLGFAFIGYEFVKVAIAYVLVATVGFGILGAITTLVIANFAQIALYALTLRRLWLEKTEFRYLKEWIRGSPFNIYATVTTLLTTLDVIVLLFRGGVIALSFYGVALAIATPVIFTSLLAIALYSKLLQQSRAEDVESSLKFTLLFSIPLSIAIVALGPSLVNILRSTYVPAATTAAILSLGFLPGSIGTVLDSVITGTERLDVEGRIDTRKLLRSKIFMSATIYFAAYAVYIPSLWFLLGYYRTDPLGAAQTTALLSSIVATSVIAGKYIIAKRCLSFHFPWTSTLKFTLVTCALIGVTPFLSQPMRALNTILLFTTGIVVYFGILYFIEDEAKMLIRAILERGRDFLGI